MLTRIALRIAVQEALRGQTLAGANVLDSQIAALDLDADGSLRTDQDKPFLSVNTDGGNISAGNGLMILFNDSSVELVIEAGISAAMVEQDEGTGVTHIVGVGLPATDAAMEMTLDLMMRGVSDALVDPANSWAEIVRSLLVSVSGVERSRVGQKSNGTRLAAHELRIRAEIVQDPVKGADIAGTTLAAFLAALAADGSPSLIKVKEAFESVLAGEAVDWQLVQRELGLSNGQSIALGGRPLAPDDNGEAAPLDEGSIEIVGRQGGDP